MSKTKKITAKELTEIKELQNKINNALINIGNAELVKSQLITEHTGLQATWTVSTGKLEKKYGSVNISLEDGTITALDSEAKLKKA
jgi:hypothetical protein